ncbi:ABC transporter substrate-binding protein [Reyranella sp.]|jgi:ABC-type glycerol-3-phosphate transport system substrate-binding protein|uniref:ABC transporter substrate-binding protein n=1 Tax=Reyranella sp. TaxID=1929291 RepID=UPI002F94709F
MGFRKVSRRRFVGGTAALSSAMVAAPFVRGAHAAGKLSVAFWDHWVPNANSATEKAVKEWAEKEKVEVQIDFVTSQGNKLLLTAAAEAQAKSGHDIMTLNTFLPARYAEQLVPVNAEMDKLIADNGKVNATVEYLGKVGGKWLAIPATVGTQFKGPCSRIDYMKQFAGIDVQKIYPAGAEPQDKDWTLDAFMKAAEACHKAGHPFGIGLGTTSDCVDTIGAIFHSFGAVMVDAKGEIVVKNDQVRQALDWYKKLMGFLPPDVAAWDDASNNKFLVSGQASMIMNPPSAWAVAKRDAPQVAENCWTHGFPAGPKGRFGPFLPFFWGIWNFSKNVPAAKSLLAHLSSAPVVESMVVASGGYDLPSFENYTKFKVWAEAEPPKGTLFHYPDPYHHQTTAIACAPAPHKIAEQMYNQGIQTQMAVRYFKGEPLEKTLDWASNELEGFMRN